MTRPCPLVVAVAAALVLSGCGATTRAMRAPKPDQTASIRTSTTEAATTTAPPVSGSGSGSTAAPDGFSVVAPWEDGEDLPLLNTCKGEDGKAPESPSVSWNELPADAVEVAITLSDVSTGNFLNWGVTGIDPAVTGIAEGRVPATAIALANSSNQTGYAAPCPNAGVHTYVLAVYALKVKPVLAVGADADAITATLEQDSSAVVKISGVVTA